MISDHGVSKWLLTGWLGAISLSATAAWGVDFRQDVQPILSRHCLRCHGPDKQSGGLRLDSHARALIPGEDGRAAIVPGDPAASELFKRVSSDDADVRMPRNVEALASGDVEILRRWIAAGAIWPSADSHWAFIKPARPALPAVAARQWSRNGIDRFVLARLEEQGMTPSLRADDYTLVRRLYLDLIGLPPTVEEADRFVRSKQPDKLEALIEHLLASPHFGEHQAVPWLDLARYADTNGYARDNPRSLWPWRDWVIQAFNRNVPYDRFTIEQLAGDLLPSPTTEQLIATGFHRNTLLNDEDGVEVEEFRVASVLDRVDTTATVWLGLTMNCAQCHSHKYDPLTQYDYYALYAFFNNTVDNGLAPDPVLKLNLPVYRAQQKIRLRMQMDAVMSRYQDIREIKPKTDQERYAMDSNINYARELYLDLQFRERNLIPSTLVMKERSNRRPSYVLQLGNFQRPIKPAVTGVPAILHDWLRGQPPNRLGLAHWLMSTNNPLVARVTVNRIWQQYFGRGLVSTPADFGMRGEAPSHPQLLDWLAVEFMESGWDLKWIHRLIVNSATYRQASVRTKTMHQVDPDNVLLGRGARFRMHAEAVRDIVLSASGRLEKAVGGLSVFPPQPEGIWENSYSFYDSRDRWVEDTGADRYRRGMYTFLRRTAAYPASQTFDLPGRNLCTVQRGRSNNPLQALNTLNDVVFVEASAGLARRMLATGRSDSEQLTYGFRSCVTRQPVERELAELEKLLSIARQTYLKDAVAAQKLVRRGRLNSDVASATEFAAWMVVANALLNLDETITKG